jgi:4-amino-4-deoxy-L-arabinose transferase-like glycosyltransferase
MNPIQYKQILTFTATFLLFVFSYFEADVILQDPLWTSYTLPWQKTLPFLIAFALYVCSYGLLSYKLSVKKHCVIFSIITIALVLALNDSILISLEWLLLLLAVWLFSKASCVILEVLSIKYRPAWLGFLVGMVLMHHIFFVLAIFDWLHLEIIYGFTALVCLIGGYRVFTQRPWGKWKHFLNREIHFSDSIIIYSIVLVAICTFITASAPQTQVDGLVYRLPYLEHLKSFGGIPFHQFLWAWLIPQPTILLFAPTYYFLGEVGAAWSVLIFSFILGLVIFEFTKFFANNITASLLAVLIILANPMIWLGSTAVYNDILIAAYSLAGIFLVIKAAKSRDYKLLTVAALLVGFACSIKLNAPIFLAASLVIIFFFSKQLRQFLLNHKVLIAILFGLLAMLPWYIWVYFQTDNPLFPFLHDYFGTKEEFTAAATYNANAAKLFGFDISIISLLSLPWNLSFNTSRFGEYLNGTFGASLVILLPLLIIGLVKRIRDGATEFLPMLLGLFITVIVTIVIMVGVLDMLVFRYILSAYILLVMVSIATFLFGKYTKIHWIITLTIGVFSILFLVLVGSRLNYGGGLGDQVYFGKQTRLEYINNITHGIQDYLNTNLQADETVLSTFFFHVNRINAQTFFVGSKKSLFNNVSDINKVKKFVKKNNVRYWVIDYVNSDYHQIYPNIVELYLTEDKIVYGGGPYIVYDLSKSTQKIQKKVTIQQELFKQIQPLDKEKIIVDFEAVTHAYTSTELNNAFSFIKGKLSFIAKTNKSLVIIDSVFYDKNNQVILRSSSSKVSNQGLNNLAFYTRVPSQASQLTLIVRPWRKQDGEIIVHSIDLDFL